MQNKLPFSLIDYKNYTNHEINYFAHLYQQLLSKNTYSNNFKSLDENCVHDYANLPIPSFKKIQNILSKVAICQLNGGLGTSMGLHTPKASIPVRNKQSFLDLKVTQLKSLQEQYQVTIPLILMNSIHTETGTKALLNKYKKTQIHTFLQNSFPRLENNTFLPCLAEDFTDKNLLYPPGHGSFYLYFYQSKLLQSLLEQDIEYLFISNIDNLGATLEPRILNYIIENKISFLMEATKKTRNDIKGGSIVYNEQGKPTLVEMSQVQQKQQKELQNIQTFKYFNTNNLWIHLPSLLKKIKEYEGNLPLALIENHKTIEGHKIIQLETAIGSAINLFDHGAILDVPRQRFLPVKNTSDLLLVQSNLFVLKQGVLLDNPKRIFNDLPLIHLGQSFRTLDSYQQRFPFIPDILSLISLTMIGDIYIQGKASFFGNVIILPEQGKKIILPNNTIIDNQVLTGELIITDL